MKQAITPERLTLYIALWLTAIYNVDFFRHVIDVYPFEGKHAFYIASLAVVLFGSIVFVLNLFAYRMTVKPLLSFVVPVSAAVVYFADAYQVVIDDEMLRNTFQTEWREAADLLTWKFVGYMAVLGVLPVWWIWRTPLRRRSWKQALRAKIVTALVALAAVIVPMVAFSKFYTSFLREHKPLRFHANPTYWIYSLGKLTYRSLNPGMKGLRAIGTDAHITSEANDTLVIVVVGEAARADHFSLNGYVRQTNPQLSQEEGVVNFSWMYACGTSTAYSVPCMFSVYTRDDFSYEKAQHTENVLDVLKRTGKVAILWRDNNSDSKGVALRVAYEDFKTPQTNPMCDVECRDEGMLVGLDKFVDKHRDKGVLIVLHQMGNHGPAYYKRYPASFEHFTPACRSNRLETCRRSEIVNAYDNALRYTDKFLAEVIAFAKGFADKKVAVLYMSDHGESLGEGGLYLHGLPYMIAPDAQKHVGAFLWMNRRFAEDVNITAVETKARETLSHDYLFHTLLGLFDVQTEVYDPKLDLTR